MECRWNYKYENIFYLLIATKLNINLSDLMHGFKTQSNSVGWSGIGLSFVKNKRRIYQYDMVKIWLIGISVLIYFL
jgi:hypothetical protein